MFLVKNKIGYCNFNYLYIYIYVIICIFSLTISILHNDCILGQVNEHIYVANLRMSEREVGLSR